EAAPAEEPAVEEAPAEEAAPAVEPAAGAAPEVISPADTSATAYAPAPVLEAQMTELLENIGKRLEDESEFDENKGAVVREANVVCVFAQVLGLHDQMNAYKLAATNIIDAARTLAASEDYASAKANYDKLMEASKTTDSKNLAWETPVASLPELMKQVPLVDGKLKSGLRRFRKTEEMAGQAIMLAAIFQGSTANVAETDDPSKADEWVKLCLEGRNHAYDLYITLDAKDKDAAQKAYDKLAQNCHDCHEIFHQAALTAE
ncbi:MAG: hypothetical protein Q4D38_06440, partial [Planctomycetia bacterium]|nr:hypothetical protein [Planctomycetia bacterium]